MKTTIIGAGQGCEAVLELLVQGRLGFLNLEILAVVDIDPSAPGVRYAKSKGWPTLSSIEEALRLPGLELVIELTGLDEVLAKIHRLVPPGVRVMDHVAARVFWDLEEVAGDLRSELEQRIALQDRLARDRGHLQDVLDAVPEMIMVLDSAMRITHVNQRFDLVVGTSTAKVRGKPLRVAFKKATREDWSVEFGRIFEEVARTGRPASMMMARDTVDGLEKHYQIGANPIFDENLEIRRVVITAREITEQVMLKRITEESARRFDQILDAVHGLITIKDLDGRYQLVNPMVEQIAGLTKEEMIGKTAKELFPPATAELIDRHDRETLRLGRRHATEERMSVGGQERFLRSERFPLTDYEGATVGICCVSRDETRQRQLQQQLLLSERLAAVGQLAAGVAHELNNPLSGILTFAEDLLLDAPADDPRRGDYETIVHETMRCRDIVRNLLEFSRQKVGLQRRLQVNDVVTHVLHLVERQASFQNIEFRMETSENLPETQGDPARIQQAVLNLVINARDSMKGKGEITIGTRVAAKEASLEIYVRDRGCGVPADRVERIFEPFFSSKGQQGHGLGLPIVKTVVEQHNGRVEVESERDAGSTFRIFLPLPTK